MTETNHLNRIEKESPHDTTNSKKRNRNEGFTSSSNSEIFPSSAEDVLRMAHSLKPVSGEGESTSLESLCNLINQNPDKFWKPSAGSGGETNASTENANNNNDDGDDDDDETESESSEVIDLQISSTPAHGNASNNNNNETEDISPTSAKKRRLIEPSVLPSQPSDTKGITEYDVAVLKIIDDCLTNAIQHCSRSNRNNRSSSLSRMKALLRALKQSIPSPMKVEQEASTMTTVTTTGAGEAVSATITTNTTQQLPSSIRTRDDKSILQTTIAHNTTISLVQGLVEVLGHGATSEPQPISPEPILSSPPRGSADRGASFLLCNEVLDDAYDDSDSDNDNVEISQDEIFIEKHLICREEVSLFGDTSSTTTIRVGKTTKTDTTLGLLQALKQQIRDKTLVLTRRRMGEPPSKA